MGEGLSSVLWIDHESDAGEEYSDRGRDAQSQESLPEFRPRPATAVKHGLRSDLSYSEGTARSICLSDH